jgi:hypothetical protein
MDVASRPGRRRAAAVSPPCRRRVAAGSWVTVLDQGCFRRPNGLDRQRTTVTGQFACAATCWLTDPSSMPVKPP